MFGISRLAEPLHRWRGELIRLCKAVGRTVAFHGSARVIGGAALRVLRTEGWGGLLQRARIFRNDITARLSRPSFSEDEAFEYYGAIPTLREDFRPKISVVVPNYNHERFLQRRLESIYGQTYQNIEVILLDDCSSDGSVAVMEQYRRKYPDVTRLVCNERNSGGAFHQWKRGLALATGELVWIAESDDYCDSDFLAGMVPFFQNQGVSLAFCRSDFVDSEAASKVWTSEEYLADVSLNLWERPFIRSSHALVNMGWGVKNLVANASSALMRNPGALAILDQPEWASLRLCGDWVFYLHVIRGGLVGYTPKVTNYYRQHSNGTSTNTQKTETYYREFAYVAKTLIQTYRLDDSVLARQRAGLLQHWRMTHGEGADDRFSALYDLAAMRSEAQPRKGNVMMVGFSMSVGGGETFPIFLANQLMQHGWAVTYFNCRVEDTVPGVRAMLDPRIPLIEVEVVHHVAPICRDMGIEIVHSHHAWVDLTLASCIHAEPRPYQVITMHGMYEMIEPERMDGIMRLMDQQVDAVVYTAEKNLAPFPQDFRERKGFTRISNALMPVPICRIPRDELGIGDEDFVLCLISRALPEKGWQEAIEAVSMAACEGRRAVHLILIGEGVEYDRLSGEFSSATVHFLGYRRNIRDYLALSDMGFLPTRFPGESFPLVLIDSLLAGRPALASNVGEIASMLESPQGTAGHVFDLEDGRIPIARLAAFIRTVADDPALYDTMRSRVAAAAEKFDITHMTQRYEEVYESMLQLH
jgi:glycosyltransferase involved in cell wall biosynthesis